MIQIRIHNNTYNIYFVEKHNKNLLIDEEIKCGITDYINKSIYIRNDLNRDTFKYTLFHEIVHAYIDSYGLLQVEWNDEIVADFVANNIINIFLIANKIYEIYRKKKL